MKTIAADSKLFGWWRAADLALVASGTGALADSILGKGIEIAGFLIPAPTLPMERVGLGAVGVALVVTGLTRGIGLVRAGRAFESEVEKYRRDASKSRADAERWRGERERLITELDRVRGVRERQRQLEQRLAELGELELQSPPVREEQIAAPEATIAAGEVALARVLNAGFRKVGSKRVRGPFQVLRAGAEYDLRVDVGPAWVDQPSLVTGEREWPEDALPERQDGFRVSVVFVSEDFSPSLIEGEMWVPARVGQSHPIIDGQTAGQNGPLSLRVTAPSIPKFRVERATPDLSDASRRSASVSNATNLDPEEYREKPSTAASMEAHGRLNLYYANNLLQSALVRVTVSSSSSFRPSRPNVVKIDFVLTAGFQNVSRELKPRQLSVTMNSDGSDRHRIIVMTDQPPEEPTQCPNVGWTPYDPNGAGNLLIRARKALLGCSAIQDADGTWIPTIDLTTNKRKKVDFIDDLTSLAALGNTLFNSAFVDVRMEKSKCAPIDWQRDLTRRLWRRSVIQIARTGPAQYAFPWTLIYEYSMIEAQREDWIECRVLDEWADDGTRVFDPDAERDHCPYDDRNWHAKNVVCPYGFWGLKHIVEEPLVAEDRLEDAVFRTRTGTPSKLSAALTNDPNLTVPIREHMKRMGNLPGITVAPRESAESWGDLCRILEAPDFVYLLCHCNEVEGQDPYLSIGDNTQILATDLSGLARTRDAAIGEIWKKRGPIVMINGCHTGALKPGEILSFVTSFGTLLAGGVIATEVSVLLPIATEIAESLVGRLTRSQPQQIGPALRAVRWELVNKGNLSGLAYTLHAMAELEVART